MLEHKADVGLGFDGDGDRCGVVDNTGEEIFADKVGVMLARDMSAIHKDAHVRRRREIDRPVRHRSGAAGSNGAKTDYWKTGHSYMKRRTNELGALAGFEKSGHFFFNTPLGRGYDDGLVSAIAICEMLDRAPGQDDGGPEGRAAEDLVVADHVAALRRRDEIRRRRRRGEAFRGGAERTARRSPGQPIRDLVTVNGVRVTVEDGSWGLVRASSNKPELVVVVESPVSRSSACATCSRRSTRVLRTHPEVGEYNQTI